MVVLWREGNDGFCLVDFLFVVSGASSDAYGVEGKKAEHLESEGDCRVDRTRSYFLSCCFERVALLVYITLHHSQLTSHLTLKVPCVRLQRQV